ncbi:hypothetical protein FQN50_009250 [Emmonsiellopsis sp. PD_5]|nr:hypothetical protein FQN50_009250 [Emmonsiellopsis sp. PD_5]
MSQHGETNRERGGGTNGKEAFCKALYKYDDSSDNSDDVDELAARLRAARQKSSKSPSKPPIRSTPAPERSSTFPDYPVSGRQKGAEDMATSTSPEQTSGIKGPVPKRRATVDGGSKSSSAKRRRESAVRVRPERQQIFKGMVFFFIPNDDIAPARRMRINKALEFGATRASLWNAASITHVIVDKKIPYEDILTYLKLDSFPPSMALVNESYPAECIRFGSLMNASHPRFHVIGAPALLKQDSKSAPTEVSGSPKLKPSRKDGGNLETPTASQKTYDEGFNLPHPSLAIDTHEEHEEMHASRQVSEREPDDLDAVIEQARAEKDLPLDPSDEEDEDMASDSASSNSDSAARKRKEAKSKKRSHPTPQWQQNFSCMHKHDGHTDDDNPNARTIEILQQMSEYYNRISDQWRTLAYRKAISALRKQKQKIVTKEQALAIPFIGERLAAKIEEIVWTNRLRRLEEANMEPQDVLLSTFLNIYGVGFAQASKWIQQGYRSLDDLRAKASLSKNQRIGLDHYDDFVKRIPRAEVEAHGAIVKKVIFDIDPAVEVIIGGSYRRGATNSGDIDLIITKDGASQDDIRSLMMDTVVPQLFAQGFLQAGLAISSRSDGSKWHGASALPGNPVWRRIDLLFVPGDEIGAALIYFTGNDVFNRSLRLLASKKGMCLNQRGLFADILRRENRVKLNSGHLLESRDEKRIFEILGVPWRPPHHRMC